MPNYQYYPVGLRAPIEGVPLQSTQGDAEVGRLYKLKMANHPESFGWNFRRRVIEAAIRLLPDFDSYAIAQRNNERAKPNSLEMINDTVSFILTGRRPVDVLIRHSIMCIEEKERFDPSIGKVQPRNVELALTGLAGREAITAWIRQEAGLEDMLCTLNALFGDLA